MAARCHGGICKSPLKFPINNSYPKIPFLIQDKSQNPKILPYASADGQATKKQKHTNYFSPTTK